MDTDFARQVLLRGGPGGHKHIETRCSAIRTMDQEKRVGWARGYGKQDRRSLHDMFGGITNAVSYPRNLGCISLETRTTERLTTALPVELGVKVSSISTVARKCTLRRQTLVTMTLLVLQFVHTQTQNELYSTQ